MHKFTNKTRSRHQDGVSIQQTTTARCTPAYVQAVIGASFNHGAIERGEAMLQRMVASPEWRSLGVEQCLDPSCHWCPTRFLFLHVPTDRVWAMEAHPGGARFIEVG